MAVLKTTTPMERLPARSGAIPGASPIRVAIADDSTVARAMIAWALREAGIDVVATASNGRDAITALGTTVVDVLILDLQMPRMDGLAALPEILAATDAAVLVVSSLTTDGAQATIEALRLGAADTLAKPNIVLGGRDGRSFSDLLVEKVRALGQRRHDRRAMAEAAPVSSPAAEAFSFAVPVSAIAIAASTGGPSAMFEFFAALSPEVDVPILVTQHLPAPFVPILAEHLGRHARRPAMVAEEGQRLRPGAIHIAPGEAHMRLAGRGDQLTVHLDTADAPSGCRPSADPMFEAVARHFGRGAVAVVLSGMGRDGAEGARQIKAHGGAVIAQDPGSSAVWGMPGVVCKEGLAGTACPPAMIARLINAFSGSPE